MRGSITPDGYRVIYLARHPLATAQDKVQEHRVVLFDTIGDGEHPCHWCGKMLVWRGQAGGRINVDHLDFDRLNNAMENLVVSCLDCNTKRMRLGRRRPRPPRVLTDEELEARRQLKRERSARYYYANRDKVLTRIAASRAAKRAEVTQ